MANPSLLRPVTLLSPKRIAAIAAASICVIAAIEVQPAHADPAQMAPQVYDKVSRDGWHLQIKIDHESINSVPNLAARLSRVS